MARNPRKPTAAELNVIRARQRVGAIRAARERGAAPRPPRQPRAPRPRERNIARARTRARSIRSEVERKTPDVQSERAVARYVQSPAYLAALRKARIAYLRDHPELRPRGGLFHGFQRLSPEDAIDVIDA